MRPSLFCIILEVMMWTKVERPGYFGRRRDQKVAELNARFGEGKWELRWVIDYSGFPQLKPTGDRTDFYSFEEACRLLYEESYFRYLSQREDEVAFICSFGQCIDNAPTNVQSGFDYTKQEAFSTHIQDIAVRNTLRRLGKWFTGPADRILVIRSKDSDGYRFGPGNIPFSWPTLITTPSMAPSWANPGSVEDFWQSNKWIVVPK